MFFISNVKSGLSLSTNKRKRIVELTTQYLSITSKRAIFSFVLYLVAVFTVVLYYSCANKISVSVRCQLEAAVGQKRLSLKQKNVYVSQARKRLFLQKKLFRIFEEFSI